MNRPYGRCSGGIQVQDERRDKKKFEMFSKNYCKFCRAVLELMRYVSK